MKLSPGVMSNHKLIISSAGSGKTTFLVKTALDNPSQKILITTYTENNEKEISNKFIKEKGCVPKNVTIQTWFSFLIQHGVKPFQGSIHDGLFEGNIKGLLLVSNKSGQKIDKNNNPIISKLGHPLYWSEEYFGKHYFTKTDKVFSDKLSKLTVKVNSASNNSIIERISRIFDHIMIDEVQDLAGYDLEVIKLLMKDCSKVTMVGDPRQVTYLTHLEAKNKPYREGKIEEFLLQKCKSLIKDGIDHTTLVKSHRCSKEICDYASKLYPDLTPTTSCECCNIKPDLHQGVFLVKTNDLEEYLNKFKPVQLRMNRNRSVNEDLMAMNMGESKGATFDRVILYTTEKMNEWVENSSTNLASGTRARFYVGLTRAKFSVAIIHDYDSDKVYTGMIKYQSEE